MRTGLAAGLPQVDAHLHVWDLSVNTYPWLTPRHGALYDTFAPEQAHEELRACGIGSAVLVQAEDSVAETEYLLRVAEEHPWVGGVVGWVPLEHPSAAEQTLQGLAGIPRFCGVRHLVHDDPRPDFLQMPAVRRSLDALARAGYPFDVPDAWPRHLAQAGALAGDLPALTVVIDHLGKPPRGRPDLADWERELRAVAARENTVAKLSGLWTAGAPFTAEALRQVWETALDLFGPARLMYGGDWPITVPHGGYQATYGVLVELVAELSPAEQREVMGGTARRVYHLPGEKDGYVTGRRS